MKKTPSLRINKRFGPENLSIGCGKIREYFDFAAIFDHTGSSPTQPNYIRKYGPKRGTWHRAEDIWIIDDKYTHAAFITQLLTKILFISQEGIADFEKLSIKNTAQCIESYGNNSGLHDFGGFGSKYSSKIKPYTPIINVVLESYALGQANGTVFYPQDFDNFLGLDILDDERIKECYRKLTKIKENDFGKMPESLLSNIGKMEHEFYESDYYHTMKQLIETCYEILTQFDYSYSDLPDGSIEATVTHFYSKLTNNSFHKDYRFGIVPTTPASPHPRVSSWNNTGFTDIEIAHAYHVAPPTNWNQGPVNLVVPYPDNLTINHAFVRGINMVDGIVRILWYGHDPKSIGEHHLAVQDLEYANYTLDRYKEKQLTWQKRGLDPQKLANDYVTLFKELYLLDQSIIDGIEKFAIKQSATETIPEQTFDEILKDPSNKKGKGPWEERRKIMDELEKEYKTECKKIVNSITIPFDEWNSTNAAPVLFYMRNVAKKYSTD